MIEAVNGGKVFDLESEADTSTIHVAASWTNRYGDQRAILGGDTYQLFVEEGVKDALNWEEVHHTFCSRDDSDSKVPRIKWDRAGMEKAWVIDGDEDSFEKLEEAVVDAGGKLADAVVPQTLQVLADVLTPREEEWDRGSNELIETQAGDEIRVTYKSARADWEVKTVEGIVTSTSPEEGKIRFVRPDGQSMKIGVGDRGDPALFTTRSSYPYMGEAVEVVLL